MRKHRHEEHLNHEAWAIPYADLMTLLLAFFVVMYAVSVVNEGKYRVMSQSLIQAFNGSSGSSVAPAPVNPGTVNTSAVVATGHSGTSVSQIALPIPMRPPPVSGAGTRPGAGQENAHPQNLQQIENQVRKALQPLIDQKMVVVRRRQDWLEIEIRTDILFPSGVAQLSASATTVLHNLAAILAPFPNPLRVEGFTDNVPINTLQYPSNWELSAARAASVARLFAAQGVLPGRLGIIGWGEVRPVKDNATIEGRNQNRRVLVVVMNERATPSREQSDSGHLRDVADAAMPPPVANTLPTAVVKSPGAPPAATLPEVTSSEVTAPATGLPVAPSIISMEKNTSGPALPVAGGVSTSKPRRASPER